MNICHIVGALMPEKKIDVSEGDLVIAADAGYLYFTDKDIEPDLIVGDFDSLDEPPSGDNVIRHPVIKDDTDMMLAVKIGLERGYKTFMLYGGIGGRLDHTLANIQTLAYISDHGGIGYLIGDDTNITVIKSSRLVFSGSESGTVSVFSLGDAAEGITLEGMFYPLNEAGITCGFPLGVSNKFVSFPASVSVRTGYLTVLWYGDFHMPVIEKI